MNGMYEELLEKLRKNNRMSGWTHIDRLIDEAAEAIEALQKENNGWQERYYELDAGHSRLFKDFCKLQQENEQLRARVAQYREALIIANHRMPDVEALSDTPADYHNPADVEALRKAREAINGYSTCPYCWGVNGHAKGCKFYEALQNIDALIGGKEDV